MKPRYGYREEGQDGRIRPGPAPFFFPGTQHYRIKLPLFFDYVTVSNAAREGARALEVAASDVCDGRLWTIWQKRLLVG